MEGHKPFARALRRHSSTRTQITQRRLRFRVSCMIPRSPMFHALNRSRLQVCQPLMALSLCVYDFGPRYSTKRHRARRLSAFVSLSANCTHTRVARSA